MLRTRPYLVCALSLALAGCAFFGSGGNIFPVWDPNYFDTPPAELGPYDVNEYTVDVPEGADGQPNVITVFAPQDAEGPLPAFFWVLGSNVQPYYHQSLHETLASWGYAVIVPGARPLTFTDFQYHRRNVDLAKQALDLALAGDLDVSIDESRIGFGGYSIGATMAVFATAEDPRIDAVVLWAPTGSPFWTGVDPDALYPLVTQPSYFLLAELDHVEPPDGFPAEMQAKMINSAITEYIIPQGLHLYFQQPTGADSPTDPVSTLTRVEQQGIAIEATRAWLDDTLGIASP
jgi:dienelactone hydrolase